MPSRVGMKYAYLLDNATNESRLGSRPVGVTIIGYLSSIAGAIEFFVGLGLLALSLQAPFLGFIWGPLGVVLAILILLEGVLDMSIGYGFLEGKGWAWWTGILASLIGLTLGITAALQTPIFIASIVKTLFVLFYLLKPGVRGFFGLSLLS